MNLAVQIRHIVRAVKSACKAPDRVKLTRTKALRLRGN
jgi:hypothetical protein